MATIRVRELRRVFRGGQSELLNGIARLSIFYEDLRLEMGELQGLHRSVVELDEKTSVETFLEASDKR